MLPNPHVSLTAMLDDTASNALSHTELLRVRER